MCALSEQDAHLIVATTESASDCDRQYNSQKIMFRKVVWIM